MRSARSYTTTSWPARVSCCAAARPEGPEPTTATRSPVLCDGGTGTTQPSSHARSMIDTSTCLIVTGSWLMPSTHAASHGAGHSRPVNSGKLLVACRRSMASCQWSRQTRSFQSGMRLPSGHPLLQNGMPQSMHRDACAFNSPSGNGSYTSCQSRMRTGTGRRVGVLRPCFRNPVGSAMCGRHHCFEHVFALLLCEPHRFEHSLVVLREHLDEVAHLVVPAGEDARRHGRVGLRLVLADDRPQPLAVVVFDWIDVDHLEVEPAGEGVVRVVHEREPTGHAGAEVAARRPEHDDLAAGHVLAPVVAHAFDDRGRARVADAEPFADDAADEALAARRPVEDDVAGDDVLL